MTSFSSGREHRHSRHRFSDYRCFPLILIISVALNLWGNRWGLPNAWHPDEVTRRAISMVSDRTVNPDHFAYGGLQYYVVAAGAIIPLSIYARTFDPEPGDPNTQAHIKWKERQQVRMIRTARAVSALMSTLVVCITFVIGTILFDTRVGYLAALLLAVSMSFVAVAHFATVDSPANFWYWLSCLFALLLWKRGDRRWYVLAALAAGLAIGTKLDRLVVLFPLLLSHLLRQEGFGLRKLVPFTIFIPISFVLANPTLIMAPFDFLDGFTRVMFFIFLRGKPGQTSYTAIPRYIHSGLGVPLFVLALCGIAYGLLNLAQRRHAESIGWLSVTFAPYYLIFGSKFIQSWYAPFFFPPLMILAAFACRDVVRGLPQRYTFAAMSVIAAIAAYSFLYTIALILQFSNDSRYLAAQWIEQHIPANATILMFKRERGPVLPRERYRIIDSLPERGVYDSVLQTHARLVHHRAYQKVHRALLDLEQWAGHRFGLPVRSRPYMDWFDRVATSYANPSKQPHGIFAVQTRQPDYVLVIGHKQRKTRASLRSVNSGYRLVTEFRFTSYFGMQPSVNFVNPRVSIFQREMDPSHPLPRLQGNTMGEPALTS